MRNPTRNPVLVGARDCQPRETNLATALPDLATEVRNLAVALQLHNLSS